MPKVYVTVSLDLSIYDEAQFRDAAYNQAIDEDLSPEEAKSFLDPEQKSLGECAQMLLDPGSGPSGSSIDGSHFSDELRS